MRPLTEALRPRREPTPEERAIIDDILALAQEHDALPPARRASFRAEVRRLCTGYQRFLAVVFTPLDHPARPALRRLLDALVADDPNAAVTAAGIFDHDELHASAARTLTDDAGRRLIQFPVRVPWLAPPNPELGAAGVPGEAVYRSLAERGPRLAHRAAAPIDDDPPF